MEILENREKLESDHKKKTLDFKSLQNISKSNKMGTQVDENGNCLNLSGDSWESIDLNYSVSPDTVLSFDFKSEKEPELSLVIFDSNSLGQDSSPFFKIFGSLACKDSSSGELSLYDGSGEWQRMNLPVGQYFKGRFSKLVFANDDDRRGEKGRTSFKNVTIFDQVKEDFTIVLPEKELNGKSEKNNDEPTVDKADNNKLSEELKVVAPSEEISPSEEVQVKENPFLPKPGSKLKSDLSFEVFTVKASGIIDILAADQDTYFIKSVSASGMTAGLSVPYKALLSLFSIEKKSKGIHWDFNCEAHKFSYLASGEVLTLAYTIASEVDSTVNSQVIINIIGTQDKPLVFQKVFTSGKESDLQINNIFFTDGEDIINTDNLSMTMTGPMKEEFVFELDIENECFSFNSEQFKYLKKNEILEFHLNQDVSETTSEIKTEIFSIIIIGHEGMLPSMVIYQNPYEKKNLFSFLEYAICETAGRALVNALTVPEKHIDSLIFTLGDCTLSFENRVLTQKNVEITEDESLYRESTKFDFEEGSEEIPSSNNLKVI